MCSNLESHWKSKEQRENVGFEQGEERKSGCGGRCSKHHRFNPFEGFKLGPTGIFVCVNSQSISLPSLRPMLVHLSTKAVMRKNNVTGRSATLSTRAGIFKYRSALRSINLPFRAEIKYLGFGQITLEIGFQT